VCYEEGGIGEQDFGPVSLAVLFVICATHISRGLRLRSRSPAVGYMLAQPEIKAYIFYSSVLRSVDLYQTKAQKAHSGTQVPRIEVIEVIDRYHGSPARQGVHDLAKLGKNLKSVDVISDDMFGLTSPRVERRPSAHKVTSLPTVEGIQKVRRDSSIPGY
jgi:hypothetical protein